MAKRIAAIVSLCLVGLVLTAVIIMSNIKIDHNIKYKSPNEIWVSYNNDTMEKVTNETHIKNIKNYIANATNEVLLTALFNKTINEKPELKYNRSIATDIPENKDFYVAYVYNNPQKIKSKNITYNQLIFTVSETNGEVETSVYISEDGTLTYRYYYVLDVDYSDLYNYLTNNGFDKK